MSRKYIEIVKKNYPVNWNKEMLKTLVEKGRITAEEYSDLTGESYEESISD